MNNLLMGSDLVKIYPINNAKAGEWGLFRVGEKIGMGLFVECLKNGILADVLGHDVLHLLHNGKVGVVF